ncbi:DsrE/DsrF/DrsH-like family protein [Cryobacterium breve]|uniref:DsrE/DsrF/DrsH-like family protein n=1 Tax=Cryobacterium breve TaxID=1259258 RepID=UPI00248CAF6C|nr:DsrE/DsrF/DrsH-like family protein [Cryobacterium breve]
MNTTSAVAASPLHLSTAAAAFAARPDGGLNVELTDSTVLAADLVILSAGVRPNTTLAKAAGLELGARGGITVDTHMRTSDPHIWAAGDSVETPHTVLPGRWLAPLAGPANREARVAAENICGRNTEYRSTQGTSIVKIFDMVAGGTGATERQAPRRRGPVSGRACAPLRPRRLLPRHRNDAGSRSSSPPTPGASSARRPPASTASTSASTCSRPPSAAARPSTTSRRLELAYAPPFGSAKDPVNMAGFVASNVLRGDLTLWYAQDYPEATAGARLIDVRTPEEFSIWHLPGAENVPLGSIRLECELWDRTGPLRLYCAVGFRSYLAYRALVQRGFTDVATLSGGSDTFRSWHEVEPESDEPPLPMTAYAEAAEFTAAATKATAQAALLANGTGVQVDLDCSGLACPGPIMKLSEKMKTLDAGDEVVVHVSDPGFASDAPAWARRNGHELVAISPEGPGYVATMRKGGAVLATRPSASVGIMSPPAPNKTSFVVFSGDLDKVLAAFIIANGAIAMGEEVSMFFTFWGLNSLRRTDPPKRERKLMDKMFATMMPSSAGSMPLSQMNMLGAGAALIKKVMRDNSVSSLPDLIMSAQAGGARLIACTMTMDLLGIAPTDLMDDVELGGVATFLGEAAESTTTLFI